MHDSCGQRPKGQTLRFSSVVMHTAVKAAEEKRADMKKLRYSRKIVKTLILVFGITLFMPVHVEAGNSIENNTEITICIDAGHGGTSTGYECSYEGMTVYEKDLNLEIALKLKDELSKYENVSVVMTRTDDTAINIRSRVQFAINEKADYLISLHNNNTNNAELASGCMVLATGSHYQAKGARNTDIYGVTEKLGKSIAGQLNLLGIPWAKELDAELNEGVARRSYNADGLAKTTVYYPDGSIADYYALIRYSMEKGLPAIIVEHAYMCNGEEYRKYLSTEEALAEVALADAKGIADALNLKLKE